MNSSTESANQSSSGFMTIIGGIALVALLGLTLSFYARVARRIWRVIAEFFPELSYLLSIVLVVAVALGAIGLLAFGASAAVRIGWIQAGKLGGDNVETLGRQITKSPDVEFEAAWGHDEHGKSDRGVSDNALPVGVALIEAKKLIDRWYALSSEERATAVELLALAANDDDVVPF